MYAIRSYYGIALDSAKAMGLKLPLLALAESLFERMSEKGFGDLGTQALYRLDRYGRGGHHRPFADLGFPAVRLMEAHERNNFV